MATIKFKAKVQEFIGRRFVHVPTLRRSHCDMNAFRRHVKYGGLANSDLFPNVLAGFRRSVTNSSGNLYFDAIPNNVTIDCSGFLAEVTIDIGE